MPCSAGISTQETEKAHAMGHGPQQEKTMPVRQRITHTPVPVHIYTEDIEEEARQQLENIARLPFIHSHVAAMPDVHFGIGATVGSVIPARGAIIPAAVGVDIGCGMNAVRLSIRAEQLPDSLRPVRRAIERAIPVGFNQHRRDRARASTIDALLQGLKRIDERHPKLNVLGGNPRSNWVRQLGTLGGGNHFIEVCLDENGEVWLMLHSGSRGIGNRIGRYFIELARKQMEDRLSQIPDADLAWFDEGSTAFDDYLHAVHWAQDYAMWNRREMMRLLVESLRRVLPPFEATGEAINCHHNYVARERHFGAEVYLTRKGAISAREGELGIIPGSMGTRSYIVRGRGNADAFCSCSHGAGRRMSRNRARREFSHADLEAQTRGVECRKDGGVLDEIPAAYKDIDQVMANQHDLVEVVHTLKQVVCVKG